MARQDSYSVASCADHVVSIKSGSWLLDRLAAERQRVRHGFTSSWCRLEPANQKRGLWLSKGPNVKRSTLDLARLPLTFFCVFLCVTFLGHLKYLLA